MSWYLVLSLVAVIIAALIYFVTKDIISVGVVILSAFFLGMFAARKPRQLEYQIDPDGINIGDKRYFYDDFRSFGIIPEGPFSSIVFMPHKRFAVPISIYYPPDQEDNIANLIGQQLPIEEHKHDAVDRLMRTIRF